MQHSISTLCRVLNVNRSSYYKHFASKLSARAKENQDICSKILCIYSFAKKRLGALKIKVLLGSTYGINISVGRVQRLMSSLALPKMSTVRPRVKKQILDDHLPCSNLLEQKFVAKAPNRVWCSDITYIKLGNSFAYLCVVIDLFARVVISWSLSKKMDTDFVIDTVNKAIRTRRIKDCVLFHSDQGTQYTSKKFRSFLNEHNFVQSFSNKSHPWDNAVVESFFKFLKHEELNRRCFSSLADLKLAVFEYIEGFYNPMRPHSANDFLAPIQKERACVSSLS